MCRCYFVQQWFHQIKHCSSRFNWWTIFQPKRKGAISGLTTSDDWFEKKNTRASVVQLVKIHYSICLVLAIDLFLYKAYVCFKPQETLRLVFTTTTWKQNIFLLINNTQNTRLRDPRSGSAELNLLLLSPCCTAPQNIHICSFENTVFKIRRKITCACVSLYAIFIFLRTSFRATDLIWFWLSVNTCSKFMSTQVWVGRLAPNWSLL